MRFIDFMHTITISSSDTLVTPLSKTMSSNCSELKSLLEHYQLRESDIRQPVSYKHLQEISLSRCTKWRFLPAALEMENPDNVVSSIEREVEKEEERKAKLFSQWRSEKGSDAKYKELIDALLEIGCKQDAEYVCELLTVPRESEGKILLTT